MSSSPLPKKGSFSNLLSLSSHKRNISSKPSQISPIRPSHPTKDPHQQPDKKSENSLNALKTQLSTLHQKNLNLKEKIKSLQKVLPSKPTKNLEESCIKLIDCLFNTLDEIFRFSLKSAKLENLEMRLIQEFQDFQTVTEKNTGIYIQKIMKWRHHFDDSLLSPADSLKEESGTRKMSRSVSSIIASTVKNYGICLKDYQCREKNELNLQEGEIVEIIRFEKNMCQGRIADRVGMFPMDLVKIV
jgi:hypothetical protein